MLDCLQKTLSYSTALHQIWFYDLVIKQLSAESKPMKIGVTCNSLQCLLVLNNHGTEALQDSCCHDAIICWDTFKLTRNLFLELMLRPVPCFLDEIRAPHKASLLVPAVLLAIAFLQMEYSGLYVGTCLPSKYFEYSSTNKVSTICTFFLQAMNVKWAIFYRFHTLT